MSRQRVVRRNLGDQIADQLRFEITSGQFRPGDALPSQRKLAADFIALTSSR